MTPGRYPRTIPMSTVQIGDSIRFTYRHKDTEVSISGTVTTIRVDGPRRYFFSSEGVLLCRYNVRTSRAIHVTLIFQPEAEQTPLSLFGDEIEKRIQ